jgi:hypothetical protein
MKRQPTRGTIRPHQRHLTPKTTAFAALRLPHLPYRCNKCAQMVRQANGFFMNRCYWLVAWVPEMAGEGWQF